MGFELSKPQISWLELGENRQDPDRCPGSTQYKPRWLLGTHYEFRKHSIYAIESHSVASVI